jgi:hypothetical protein
MKQAIRALGWATTTLWILVILFSGTVVYSAMQIGMDFQGEPQITTSNGTLKMALPFSISNNGFYDITNMNITTSILTENETVISTSSTLLEIIPRGGLINATHEVVISLKDMLAKNLTYLVFNDTKLNMEMSVRLVYANALPLKISSNQTMRWGAPIYNLTVDEVSFTPPNQADVSLSFENHAFFALNGTIYLELVDEIGNKIGDGSQDVLVLPGSRYAETIKVTLTVTPPFEVAEVHLSFVTSLFSLGPVVITLG